MKGSQIELESDLNPFLYTRNCFIKMLYIIKDTGHYWSLVILLSKTSLLIVSQHMHKKQTCENLSSIGRRSCVRSDA